MVTFLSPRLLPLTGSMSLSTIVLISSLQLCSSPAGELFVDLEEPFNRFTELSSALPALFWSLLDPGHPEVVGCSSGMPRYTALAMWGTYNVIIVIILLNLLIAMMNVAMEAITEDRVASWKYHR